VNVTVPVGVPAGLVDSEKVSLALAIWADEILLNKKRAINDEKIILGIIIFSSFGIGGKCPPASECVTEAENLSSTSKRSLTTLAARGKKKRSRSTARIGTKKNREPYRGCSRLRASHESPPTNSLLAATTTPVSVLMISAFTSTSGLVSGLISMVMSISPLTPDAFGAGVMSIEAPCPGTIVKGADVVRDATVWTHTPLELHVPCVFIWVLKVTVSDLTVLRWGTMAVIRRIWFGPKVMTPVSATKPEIVVALVESALIIFVPSITLMCWPYDRPANEMIANK
jgi:hypothetical protein